MLKEFGVEVAIVDGGARSDLWAAQESTTLALGARRATEWRPASHVLHVAGGCLAALARPGSGQHALDQAVLVEFRAALREAVELAIHLYQRNANVQFLAVSDPADLEFGPVGCEV